MSPGRKPRGTSPNPVARARRQSSRLAQQSGIQAPLPVAPRIHGETNYTSKLPTLEETKQNGRVDGRQLVPWQYESVESSLTLIMYYETAKLLQEQGIEFPYARIGHRLMPGTSAEAVRQALARKRRQSVANGYFVPPIFRKRGTVENPELRGFIRSHPGDAEKLQELQPIGYNENFVHPSKPDETGHLFKLNDTKKQNKRIYKFKNQTSVSSKSLASPTISTASGAPESFVEEDDDVLDDNSSWVAPQQTEPPGMPSWLPSQPQYQAGAIGNAAMYPGETSGEQSFNQGFGDAYQGNQVFNNLVGEVNYNPSLTNLPLENVQYTGGFKGWKSETQYAFDGQNREGEIAHLNTFNIYDGLQADPGQTIDPDHLENRDYPGLWTSEVDQFLDHNQESTDQIEKANGIEKRDSAEVTKEVLTASDGLDETSPTDDVKPLDLFEIISRTPRIGDIPAPSGIAGFNPADTLNQPGSNMPFDIPNLGLPARDTSEENVTDLYHTEQATAYQPSSGDNHSVQEYQNYSIEHSSTGVQGAYQPQQNMPPFQIDYSEPVAPDENEFSASEFLIFEPKDD